MINVMLKNIKYIRMMKAVRYSMITMSLVLCFISVSCRNEDTVSEQFFDEDAVTVRLNLTTRGVETGDSDLLDELSSDPFQWFKTGTLFPQAPAQRQESTHKNPGVPREAVQMSKRYRRFVCSRSDNSPSIFQRNT